MTANPAFAPRRSSLVTLPQVGKAETSLSVVVPCFNEQDNLPSLVERIKKLFDSKGMRGNLVLVNDGSRDRTGEVIAELETRYPGLIIGCNHPKNQGIAVAWRTGVNAATGTYICFIDADLQHPPEEIYRLYREMVAGRADVIQGTRSSIGRIRDSRYLYSRVLNGLLNIAFDMRATDNKSGFVMARRETIADLVDHLYNYYYYNTFITVAAKAKGYSVHEVETLFVSRNAGQSYIQGFPLKLIYRCYVDLFKAIVEFRFRPQTNNDVLARYLKEHPVTKKDVEYTGFRKFWYNAFFATMPLHKWMLSKNAKTMLAQLRQTQWLAPQQIAEIQELKMRRLIRHAYQHVPYYTAAMDAAGIRPEEIQSLDDLQKMPMLGKSDVREHLYFDLFSDLHNKQEMLKINTSGSTGVPFVTYAEKTQLEMRFASTWRSMEWTGWRLGDPCARLWHQTLGMSLTQIAREYIDAFFQRRLFIPAYEMRESNIREMVTKLAQHKPVLIDGYAESFNFLAHYLQKHDAPDFHPKAVMSSAQVMPEQVRAVIQDKFKTKVFDKYGSREFSGIAYECAQQDGHHIMAESYIVEILKDGKPAQPGEIGEVVVTDLNNFCVPLIRYRIGDLAMAMDNSKPCACGRGLPRIGQIIGRSQGMIVCANGTWLPSTFFAHLFKDYDYIVRQFQIVQKERGAFDLKVVKADQFSEKGMQEIVTVLRKFTGDDTRIEVVYVDEIPLVRTGKRTNTVSHLNLDFQKLADEGINKVTVNPNQEQE